MSATTKTPDEKWTKGPWRTYLQGDSTAWIVATEKRDSYGRSEQDIVRVVSGEANARLIAAAPDLAEALLVLVKNAFDHSCVEHSNALMVPASAIEDARAALRKAGAL